MGTNTIIGTKALAEMAVEVDRWCDRKGWNERLEDRSQGDWMILLVSELVEAYEDHRDGYEPNELYFEDGATPRRYSLADVQEIRVLQERDGDRPTNFKPCGVPVEIADAFIRMLHYCARHGIDLEAMYELKMAYNEGRPYRHGRAGDVAGGSRVA